MGRWLAIGQRGTDGDFGGFTDLIARLISLHHHIQLLRAVLHLQLGHTQPKGGFAQIHHGRRCHVFFAAIPERIPPLAWCLVAPGEKAVPRHFIQAPAQGQHTHKHIRAPARLHGQRNRRVFALQLHHLRMQHPFTLHAHQRCRFAKRHAHLQLGSFSRAVAGFFCQHIHAVVVLATKPQLALPRHPDRVCRLRSVALFVLHGSNQFDLTSLHHLHLTQQQAACVAFATAHLAQALAAALVVIGVETSDQTLACGGGGVLHRLHLQWHAGLRVALGVHRHRLQAHLAAYRHPALGANSGQYRRRPHTVAAAQGLNFAIRVSKAGFQHQILCILNRRQRRQRDLALTLCIQAQRQLIGHQPCAIAAGVFRLTIALLLRTRRAEAVACPALKAHPSVTQQGTDLHRVTTGCTAIDKVQADSHRHGLGLYQHRLFHGLHAALEDRQTEGFHPELTRLQHALAALCLFWPAQLDRVQTQFGRNGGRKTADGIAPAVVRGRPLQRLLVLLPAAHMRNHQLCRPVWWQCQPLQRLLAHKVLHRHGFTSAHQVAIQHRMRHPFRATSPGSRQIEAPWLNATLPITPHKRHVLHALAAVARTDKPLAAALVVVAARRLPVQIRQHQQALGIGFASGMGLAPAIGYLHVSTHHWLALVQGSDPDRRAFAA